MSASRSSLLWPEALAQVDACLACPSRAFTFLPELLPPPGSLLSEQLFTLAISDPPQVPEIVINEMTLLFHHSEITLRFEYTQNWVNLFHGAIVFPSNLAITIGP